MPPHPQQRDPVWRAWTLLRLCQLWHSPLREASPSLNNPKLGLRFQCCQWVSQPTPKPLPEKLPDFPPSDPPELRRVTSRCGWLGWVSGAAVAVVSAATAPRAEAPFPEKQQRQPAGAGAD